MERENRVIVDQNKKIRNRLKRAEGQLRGVQKMLEENQECESVVTQLTAVRSSVDRIIGLIVAENLKDCLMNHEGNDLAQQEKIEQAIQLIVKK